MFPISISAIAVALIALAAGSVSGNGTVTFGSSVEHITVRASGNSGRATFNDKAAGGNFNGQIAVNCVNVVGNTATVSGIVTHANKKDLLGREGVFQVVDNGSRGSDMASIINFHDPGTSTDCRAGEFDLAPVKGNFTVGQ